MHVCHCRIQPAVPRTRNPARCNRARQGIESAIAAICSRCAVVIVCLPCRSSQGRGHRPPGRGFGAGTPYRHGSSASKLPGVGAPVLAEHAEATLLSWTWLRLNIAGALPEHCGKDFKCHQRMSAGSAQSLEAPELFKRRRCKSLGVYIADTCCIDMRGV